MVDYVQPEAKKDTFHCPHCGSFSDQSWTYLRVNKYDERIRRYVVIQQDSFNIGCCRRCADVTIWKDNLMIFPFTGNAPLPNPDMSSDIKRDYLEARDIVTRSPRSACVLLRLCVEKMCDEKNATGSTLNEKIGVLVRQGLDDKIKNALDSVRVIGGQAVHPLTMDLEDDTKTATALFKIVNYISDWAHTREKTIQSVFDSLPDEKKKAIRDRDNSQSGS